MVDTDTYRRGVGLAEVEKRHKAVFNPLQLQGILLVGVLELTESASRIHKVSGVYPHLLDMERGLLGGARIEMYVGHKRHAAATLTQSAAYLPHIGGLPYPLGGKAVDVSPCGGNPFGLRHRSLGVHSRGVVHRLEADGESAPDFHVAHTGGRGLAPAIIENTHSQLSLPG